MSDVAPALVVAQQGAIRAARQAPAARRASGVYRAGPPPMAGVDRRPPAATPGLYRTPPLRPAPPPRGGWARPSSYWWHPGMAIVAGVAVGVVVASVASRWAGAPPAPGHCWYYTDASRRNGFWDVCPF